jgi:hypothetical protein
VKASIQRNNENVVIDPLSGSLKAAKLLSACVTSSNSALSGEKHPEIHTGEYWLL